jgi:purine-binding chemotaxis protein CheW
MSEEVSDILESTHGRDSASSNSDKRKYLVFKLGSEKFGVPLSSVKEVIGLTDITEIPQVPSYFQGLINLRGKIISVIDLRKKMGISKAEYEPKKTSIIITEIQGVDLGVIVDDVEEVASYEKESQIEESIDVQGAVSREYLQGVAKTEDDKSVLLMNMDKILSSSDLAVLKQKAA